MILAVSLIALLGYRINGTSAVNAFFYPGTMGVLLMLVSYFVCNTGAIVYLYLRGERRAPLPEVAIPLIALAIIVYVLYQNTLADSLEYPYTVFPLVVAGWPDLNTLSVRLVITTAILFGFLTAAFADVLTQGPIDQEFEEDDHRRSRDQHPARH